MPIHTIKSLPLLGDSQLTIRVMDPVESVRKAIVGGPLDVAALEKLSFDPYLVDTLRPTLLPLLAELLAARPDVAVTIPESLINVLLRKMPIDLVLSATNLSPASLENHVVRPLLLNQLVLKAKSTEDTVLTQELLKTSFNLLKHADLDSLSSSLLEKLTVVVPRSALLLIPFAELASGSAVQRARLMELNLRLLGVRTVPPKEFLGVSWDFTDLLLAGVQIDYVHKLVNYFVAHPEVQLAGQKQFYTLAEHYDPSSLLANAAEAALARLCQCVEPMFFTLDAQFTLIRPDRIGLLARIPAPYIVKHHCDIIDQLELSTNTLPAVANIVRSLAGLQRLQLSRARLLNLAVPSQLAVAASAMSSHEGAAYFAQHYADVLRNALSAPETEDLRDLKTELELNMRVFGQQCGVGPSVATATGQ